jgi:hypothetical protein
MTHCPSTLIVRHNGATIDVIRWLEGDIRKHDHSPYFSMLVTFGAAISVVRSERLESTVAKISKMDFYKLVRSMNILKALNDDGSVTFEGIRFHGSESIHDGEVNFE